MIRPSADAPGINESTDSILDGDLDSDDELDTDVELPEPTAALKAIRIPAQSGPAEAELTERERQVLAFERRWWRHAGAKEQAIRDTFGLSATRYYQILNGLLDNPSALAAEPVLIGRLRRLRASQARARRR
ncbi:MAG TPA: DUF3263 domain-containing protein [Micromonosporaceae bacterium]|nr:DUF3263 domain-containing protein [Micromonosporaceae bacterium]